MENKSIDKQQNETIMSDVYGFSRVLELVFTDTIMLFLSISKSPFVYCILYFALYILERDGHSLTTSYFYSIRLIKEQIFFESALFFYQL